MQLWKNRHGMTLMEVLITVALIVLLSAITIPQLSNWRSTAQKATCETNCAAIENRLQTLQLRNRKNWTQLCADGDFAAADMTDGYTCPGGGAYTIDANGHVVCSVHGSGSEDHPGSGTVFEGNAAAGIMDKLQEIGMINSDGTLTNNAFSGYQKFNSLDSGVGSYTNYPDSLAAINSIFGGQSVSWSIQSVSGYFQIAWTVQDISTMQPGDTIYIIRYNTGGTYKGLFSIWKTTVVLGGTRPNNFNIINIAPPNQNQIVSADLDKTDFNSVKALYDQVLVDHGITF